MLSASVRGAFVALSLILTGCVSVSSLETAVPDSALVRDPRLVGEWVSPGDGGRPERASIALTAAGVYTVTFVDSQGDTVVLDGRLGRLGDRWMFDLVAGGTADSIVERYGALLTHLQVVIRFSGGALEVTGFDGDTLKAALRAGTVRLGYVIRPNGDVLLTDPTPRLAAGLAAFARRRGALMPPQQWRREARLP